ncbi:hypothetical protein HDV05_001488, partial [Chytridiales sp. JEL 0842]
MIMRKHDLQRHVRSIHSEQKPWICNCCGSKFARSDALRRHLEVEEKKDNLTGGVHMNATSSMPLKRQTGSKTAKKRDRSGSGETVTDEQPEKTEPKKAKAKKQRVLKADPASLALDSKPGKKIQQQQKPLDTSALPSTSYSSSTISYQPVMSNWRPSLDPPVSPSYSTIHQSGAFYAPPPPAPPYHHQQHQQQQQQQQQL